MMSTHNKTSWHHNSYCFAFSYWNISQAIRVYVLFVSFLKYIDWCCPCHNIILERYISTAYHETNTVRRKFWNHGPRNTIKKVSINRMQKRRTEWGVGGGESEAMELTGKKENIFWVYSKLTSQKKIIRAKLENSNRQHK